MHPQNTIILEQLAEDHPDLSEKELMILFNELPNE